VLLDWGGVGMALLLFHSGLLPLFGFFSWNFKGRFRTMLHKMTILMTDFAFEGQLFIINLLQVIPFIHGEIDSFR